MSTKSLKWNKYFVTNDEALEMIDGWRNADSAGKSKIETKVVSRLSYLVQSRIKRHKGNSFYDDLLQEGKIGLMKAVHDFDSDRGTNFFKFATWHIQTRIRRFLMKEVCRSEFPSGLHVHDSAQPEFDEMLERSQSVSMAMRCLPEREKVVISMRFGMSGDSPRTLREIGEKLGISRERVRQIEMNALRRLGKSPSMICFAQDAR